MLLMLFRECPAGRLLKNIFKTLNQISASRVWRSQSSYADNKKLVEHI
jgi:hypothetical protein